MNMTYAYATIAYTALFLSMGIVLLTVYVPNDKRLSPYQTSRKIFACAYLLLGVTGISDFVFLPADGERDYITVYSMVTVSLIHAWLNTYAYLLLQEPSVKSIRSFQCYGLLGLPLILLVGGAIIFFPRLHTFASFVLGAAYAGQIFWTISVCRREFHASAQAMENYYDGTLRFSWMNGVLTMTLGLAVMNLVNFYIVELSLPLRLVTTLFYLYFAIRLLNYVHVFIYVGEARKEEEAETNPPIATNGYTEKLVPLIARWCDAKHFCKDSLTIKMVAYEMGTNHTYLSAYLNKRLGCSFQQWLNTLRIEESKNLLRKYPYKTIEEISRMVGIIQSYNFSRWFKQISGISPQQWKKQDDSD